MARLSFLLVCVGVTFSGAAKAQTTTSLPHLPALPAPDAPDALNKPAQGAPAQEIPSNQAHAAFTANLPNVTFVLDEGKPRCTAPCRMVLPKGVHRVAVSHEGRRPIQLDAFVDIRQPLRFEATYTSYVGVRVAGYIIGGTSLLAAALIFNAASTEENCTKERECDNSLDPGAALAAAIAASVGFITGLILATRYDKVTVNVVPQVFTKRTERAHTAQAPALTGGGFGLHVRF